MYPLFRISTRYTQTSVGRTFLKDFVYTYLDFVYEAESVPNSERAKWR